MGTVLLAGSTLHGVAAPLAHTASRSRGAVEWNMTGVEPWWISACAPCSSTSPPRGSPSQSCLGFAHSRASCARVPGGGSRAGSSSLEPRSSRFGSFTVRSWSRTRRGGSYHSRILCRVSESRTVRFPGRSGEGQISSHRAISLWLGGRVSPSRRSRAVRSRSTEHPSRRPIVTPLRFGMLERSSTAEV